MNKYKERKLERENSTYKTLGWPTKFTHHHNADSTNFQFEWKTTAKGQARRLFLVTQKALVSHQVNADEMHQLQRQHHLRSLSTSLTPLLGISPERVKVQLRTKISEVSGGCHFSDSEKGMPTPKLPPAAA